jgi:hypothetical protein
MSSWRKMWLSSSRRLWMSRGNCFFSLDESIETDVLHTRTSVTNCAGLYNIKITGDYVWDAFVITTLLEDCKRRMCSLTIPQTGNQRDRFMQAMINRNQCIQLYGFKDIRRHYCNRCTRMYANDQGVSECCIVTLCHIPYSGPYFPSLLSLSFPLCMLYFSRISPATSVHHPTWYPAFQTLQPACTPDPWIFGSSDL